MSEQYFVKYKGRLQGPFSVDQLKTLMKRGKLTRAHLVSEDRKTWVALGDIKGIKKEAPPTPAPEQFQSSEIPMQPDSPTNIHPSSTHTQTNQPQQIQQQHTQSLQHSSQQQLYSLDGNQAFLNPSTALQLMSKRFMRWTMTSGIILAALIILPISILTIDDNSRILWSWSGWESYSATVKFLFIYTILASAGLIVISVTTRGLPRAVTTLGIVLIACILLLSNNSSSNEAVLRVALMAIPCSILAASFQWRNLGPTIVRRVLTCVIGGFTALVCASFTIEMLFSIDLNELDGAPSDVTTFAIFAIIMSVAGLGLGIACGVLGILQVKPDAKRSTAKLGLVFSRIAPVCLLLGFLVLVIGVSMLLLNRFGENNFMGAFTLLALRMIIAPLTILVLIECGTYELMLVCSSFVENRISPSGTYQSNPPQPNYSQPQQAQQADQTSQQEQQQQY